MKSVASKIAIITGELGAILKDGHNDSYDFISYEQFYAVLRPLIAKHKLVCLPNITQWDEVIQKIKAKVWNKTTKNYEDGEKEIIRTRLCGTIKMICGETGEMIEISAVGADQDYGGKSMAQAITEFDKRALMKIFKVSSKGDVDPDSRTVNVGDDEEEPKNKPDTDRTKKKPINMPPLTKTESPKEKEEQKPAEVPVKTEEPKPAEKSAPDKTALYHIHFMKQLGKSGQVKDALDWIRKEYHKETTELSVTEMKQILAQMQAFLPSVTFEI
jgi:hypothetical protein